MAKIFGKTLDIDGNRSLYLEARDNSTFIFERCAWAVINLWKRPDIVALLGDKRLKPAIDTLSRNRGKAPEHGFAGVVCSVGEEGNPDDLSKDGGKALAGDLKRCLSSLRYDRTLRTAESGGTFGCLTIRLKWGTNGDTVARWTESMLKIERSKEKVPPGNKESLEAFEQAIDQCMSHLPDSYEPRRAVLITMIDTLRTEDCSRVGGALKSRDREPPKRNIRRQERLGQVGQC